jgi:hypothetical protein
MMNTPSMYSVDQLLKARQNGVPDYVVVPMLQKAMAQKQAMAQQQALQQGAPKPPVAQQILDAAHNDVMQEHMARQVEEAPEPRGIDSLPSGIDESDYAHGGIIAFAGDTDGSLVPGYPAFDTNPYAGQYTDEEKNPDVLTEQFSKRMGTDPGVAKQEERIASREAALKGEEDKAPWMALMQAGLATMGGTSPNAFANIGAGATKGLESYGESKKGLAARADKLDDLRSKIEESQRAEALAAVKYGLESAERRRLSDHTDKLKGAEAQLKYNEDVAKHGIEKEKIAVDREGHQLTAGSAAASLAERKQYHDSLGGKGGLKGMTANQLADTLNDRIQGLNKDEIAINSNDDLSPEEKEYHLANIKGVRNGYRKQILSVAKGNSPDFSYLEELNSVIDTPYSPQSTSQPGAVVKPAPIGKTSVSNW